MTFCNKTLNIETRVFQADLKNSLRFRDSHKNVPHFSRRIIMEILLLVLGVIACILLLPLLFPVAIAAVAIGFLYLLMTKGIILLFNALG